MTIELRVPALDGLAQLIAALERDWTPDTTRGRVAAQEELAAIAKDAAGYLQRQTNPEAAGDPITLPDGSKVARLPGRQFWVWDGEFCGQVNLRWQHGTPALPPHVLGHVGYSIVPWKRRQGCATQAVRLVLPHARAEGLPYVELTTDPDNSASQKVITANGGVLVERFTKPAAYGSTPGLRFHIAL